MPLSPSSISYAHLHSLYTVHYIHYTLIVYRAVPCITPNIHYCIPCITLIVHRVLQSLYQALHSLCRALHSLYAVHYIGQSRTTASKDAKGLNDACLHNCILEPLTSWLATLVDSQMIMHTLQLLDIHTHHCLLCLICC